MTQQIELGLDTFGDIQAGPDGQALSQAQVIRHVIEEGVLSDAVGVDAFGLGEHHRADFAISTPDVVLAAIAARTSVSGWAPPSRCCLRTIRCACFSVSPHSTPPPMDA